ncbi:MAG: type II secretion system protein GspG [Gemmataceae bacterium]|nr:type II secretion system protein GspG [Gemmataceae bacterium]
MRERVRTAVGRSLVAAAVGVAVAGTAYLGAYFERGSHPNYRWTEIMTQSSLDDIQKAVEEHRQVTGRLPASLSEMPSLKDRHGTDADGRFVDLWGHPFRYQVEGEDFTLCSFGRDGRPGGDGLDADIYPTSAGRPFQPPTLRQFTFDLPTVAVQETCFAAGVCAALVCLLPSRNRRGVGFFARVGVTAVGAVLVAVVLSALHVPSGH